MGHGVASARNAIFNSNASSTSLYTRNVRLFCGLSVTATPLLAYDVALIVLEQFSKPIATSLTCVDLISMLDSISEFNRFFRCCRRRPYDLASYANAHSPNAAPTPDV